MQKSSLEEYLQTAELAARKAGSLLKDWTGKLGVRQKAKADLVTEADLASQKAIREVLLTRYPEHGFLGEEGHAAHQDHEFVWVVDPLDGTTNYVHDCPFFSVSIALRKSRELLVGVVYDPIQDECFCAIHGYGAWLGDKRLHVSQIDSLSEALVVTSFPPGVQRDHPQIECFLNILDKSQSLRRTGSAALNLVYVASGRFDAFWAPSMNAWDVAAGVLILNESQGKCTDFENRPYWIDDPRLLSSNGTTLHDQIRGCLTPLSS